jgi:exodeoxyribonuclease VII small subunit
LTRSAQPRAPKGAGFEKSLRELEQLVEKLEHGELPLEEALQTFERGVALTRECQTALQAAQSRVEILIERNGRQQAVAFEADETADDAGDEDDDDDDDTEEE